MKDSGNSCAGDEHPQGTHVFKFKARGHRHITALHPTTFEFTKDTELTHRGDCIVAVGAECGLRELPPGISHAMMKPGTVMVVRIRCNGMEEVVRGRGDSGLTYTSPTDMVGRRSGYTCGRTLMVGADMAARDFSRELVGELRGGGEVEVVIEVMSG